MLRRLSIGWQLALLPLVFGLGLVLLVWQQQSGLEDNKTRGASIDLAGRQRSLTEAVVGEGLARLMGADADPEPLLDLFEDTAEALRDGGAQRRTNGEPVVLLPASGDVRATLELQLDAVGTTRAALAGLATADEADRAAAVERLREAAGAQLEAAQATVSALVAESEAALAGLGRRAILTGLAVLLVGVALAGVVAAPIRRETRRLGEAVGALAEGDLAPRPGPIADDELGRLAADLEQAVERIAGALGVEEVDWASFGREAAEQRRQLVAMVDGAPVAMLRCGPDGRFVYANDAAVGYFRRHGLGDPVGRGPEAFERATDALDRALRTVGDDSLRLELECHGEVLSAEVFDVERNGDGCDGSVLSFEVVTEEVEARRRNETAVADAADSAAQLGKVAEELVGLLEDTVGITGRVSGDTDEVSQGTAAVAAAAEEMTTTVTELARHAQDLAARVEQSAEAAARSAELMGLLQEAGSEIGRVTDAIAAIADQTNLLALNASIEAAGAGEAGRGFAVVASEVKDLARETMQSTASIAGQIEAIQQRSSDAVHAVGEINLGLEGVRELARSLAAGVEEQSATTGEISQSIAGAAERASQIRGEICGLAASAQASSGTANQVREVVERLESLAARLTGAAG